MQEIIKSKSTNYVWVYPMYDAQYDDVWVQYPIHYEELGVERWEVPQEVADIITQDAAFSRDDYLVHAPPYQVVANRDSSDEERYIDFNSFDDAETMGYEMFRAFNGQVVIEILGCLGQTVDAYRPEQETKANAGEKERVIEIKLHFKGSRLVSAESNVTEEEKPKQTLWVEAIFYSRLTEGGIYDENRMYEFPAPTQDLLYYTEKVLLGLIRPRYQSENGWEPSRIEIIKWGLK